ncbi:MAG TPA: hypothetical protein VG841_10475 [Caulobacterales bacterium]|nr:hypothetical protein [Caulobacterales bacterium]
MSEYWFARRHPIGAMRGGMSPVHWKGWAARAVYGTILIAAVAGAAWGAMNDHVALGVALLVALPFAGTLWLVQTIHKKGDHAHTAAEYREGKIGV